MRTIKKRADEYIGHSMDIDEPSSITAKRLAFIAGAKSEHKELTRWNNPIDHPEEGVEVLCKYKCCSGRIHYITAWYSEFHKGYMNDGYIRTILGWREIHK